MEGRRWVRTVRRHPVITGLILVVPIAGAGLVGATRHRPAGSFTPAQDRSALIKFSHAKHLTEVGAECLDCHGGVEKSTRAADNFLGTMANCYACHDQQDTECAFCHKEPGPNYTAFAAAEREIHFDHERHVSRGIDCAACHRGMEKVDFAGPEQMPSMADCMACHDGSKASGECSVCHTHLTELRPVSHTPEWLHRHNTLVRVEEQNCAACHGASDCQECHEGASLVATREKPEDHFAAFGPTSDPHSSKWLILDRVHGLDYRNTHGLDARGKTQDCQVCHEPATFCAECHRPEGDVNLFKPRWHGGADWGAIAGGVGTGGGRHAELARRDIETCAACHDVQGEDPTCLACHMDRQPGVGNDPRTHEPGFMRDVQGPWHNDLNETCYACHQPSAFNTPGFCIYCHGPKGDG